jgi:hypothetical protein
VKRDAPFEKLKSVPDLYAMKKEHLFFPVSLKTSMILLSIQQDFSVPQDNKKRKSEVIISMTSLS